MKTTRTYFQVLLATVAAGLLLANCTIKESKGDDDDDDTTSGSKCKKNDKTSGCGCSDGATGYQVCGSDGVFGSCVCPEGTTPAATGGNASTGGTGNVSTGGTGNASTGGSGGVAAATSTDGGAGGAGGTGLPAFDPDDCEACLQVLCEDEFAACLDDYKDPNLVGQPCLAEDGESGQYLAIANCINAERVDGLVKRDIVRNCGVTMGASATDATFNDAWAPASMRDATTNLLNCMATSSQETPNADWANSDDNFPVDSNLNVNPTPWPEDSCAKLACTGKFN